MYQSNFDCKHETGVPTNQDCEHETGVMSKDVTPNLD